jgi:hypothetical protein
MGGGNFQRTGIASTGYFNSLTINGTLEFANTFVGTINATTFDGSGTVIYSAAGDQYFLSKVASGGGNEPNTYNNLTILGGGNKSLHNNVTVNGTLTLTNGNITSLSSDLLTLSSSATTSGGSATSFVDGPLAISGTGNKTFPIGKANAYRPATLGSIAGTDPVIQAEVFNTDPGGTAGTGIDNISTVRYWQIDVTGGSFTSGTVNLVYDSDDGVTDASNLRIAQSSTVNGTYDDIGGTGSAIDAGNITSSSVSTLGYFTLANVTGGSNPLPVELASFSASVRDTKVKLNWATASEVNNFGFEIQRQAHTSTSLSVTNWEKVGFVSGNGNSNSPKSYSFTDNDVAFGKYIYRLKQIDNDGTYEYSKTVEVDLGTPKKFELSQNYPNPFNPTTTISYNLPEAGNVTLIIYNLLGQEIKTLVNEYKEAGVYTINFDASQLDSGLYFYKLQVGSFTQTRKMTLVK